MLIVTNKLYVQILSQDENNHSCKECSIRIKSIEDTIIQVEQSARKRSVPSNSDDFVEAVIRPKIFRTFSDEIQRLLPESTGSSQESTEKSGQLPVGILLPCSRDCRCFPAGFGDFPASFLRNPVAGTIDLGNR